MSGEVINFGKYKGKPLEILLNDKGYCDWLRTRPDFEKRYPVVYTFIINSFPQPQDSKEHNQMQIKFLDDAYALKFAYFLYPELFHWNSREINNRVSSALASARKNIEHLVATREESVQRHIDEIKNRKLLYICNRDIESGHDVSYFVTYGVPKMMRAVAIRAEIKPVVGDDYPSVLRQMKLQPPVQSHGWDFNESFRCLFVRAYDGEGATKDQFVKLFETQRFKVVFESDIENVTLPPYDEIFKHEMI